MMKLMDRIAEGRGHLREIDMLLELTLVFLRHYLYPRSIHLLISIHLLVHLAQQTNRGSNDLCSWRRRRMAHSGFDETLST